MQKNEKNLPVKMIKKYPQVFEALLEFERTRKLPKTSYREKLNITLDGNLLRKFRHYCEEKGSVMSRVIEKHIKEELGKNAVSAG